MIINNKENKNNIYIYKKVLTSISINTSTSKKYLSKESYSNILYLLVKKEYTYFSEIKRIFNLTTNIYLPKLESEGIIQRRLPTEKEKIYIKTLFSNIGNKYLKTPMIYEFTKEGKQYFTQPKVFEMLQVFSSPGIDDFIILEKNEYNNILLKEKETKELQERAWQHKKQLLEKRGYIFENGN